jgi:hypothetical protein
MFPFHYLQHRCNQRWLTITLLLFLLDFTGCSGSKLEQPSGEAKSPEPMDALSFAGGGGSGVGAGEGASPIKLDEKFVRRIDRKIVYTATVEAVVSDFDAAGKKLQEIIKQHQGLLGQSEITGTTGVQRTGRWKVRIPVAQFEPFLQEVAKLGELQRNAIDSKDVTEEFYDLEARLKNKKIEEERLQNHLKNTTAKLQEILEVEKELSRVREEIERLEGRRNLLQNLTSLTTVDITLREIRDYKPPTAPTFGTQISRTFSNSWSALQDFGAGLVLFLVALAPWLPILLVLGIVLYFLSRRVVRRSRPVVLPATPIAQE